MTSPSSSATAQITQEADPSLTGRLQLRTARRADGRTVAAEQFSSGALRVLRPHYQDASGQALITVVNPGGGFLGADRYVVEYDGGPGSSALLTTQSATKIYRTPQGPARQHTKVRLAAGALLESVPDQLIAYRDAQFVQRTDVDLHPEACYFAAEVITPGWSPDAEPFTYQEVRLHTIIRCGGTPLLWDNLVLRPGTTDPRDLGWLEGRSHCASVVVAGPGVDRRCLDLIRELVDGFAGVRVGASLLSRPGLVLRALGQDTGTLTELIRQVGTVIRAEAWPGNAPSSWDLRKY